MRRLIGLGLLLLLLTGCTLQPSDTPVAAPAAKATPTADVWPSAVIVPVSPPWTPFAPTPPPPLVATWAGPTWTPLPAPVPTGTLPYGVWTMTPAPFNP